MKSSLIASLRCAALFLFACWGLSLAEPRPLAHAAEEAVATNVYYVIPLAELKYTDEAPSDEWRASWGPKFHDRVDLIRAALDGPGEAYLKATNRPFEFQLFLTAPAGKPISGRLFLPPASDEKGASGRIVSFRIPADAKPCERVEYLRHLQSYYHDLLSLRAAGTAWFRHRQREVNQELFGQGDDSPATDEGEFRDQSWRAESEFERTFDLISGGRALSENLQLDRALPVSKEDLEEVAIDSLEGISVAEMDWQPLIKDVQPQLDPLAESIPADQHALFFPSFEALLQATDFADQQGSLLLGVTEPRSESAMSRERYETQLCLPMSTLARLLGPKVISSVAITGGDLYFRTGTDVAVLFAGPNLPALRALVETRVMLTATTNSDAKPVTGEVAGVSYRGLRSPDRTICSYVATVGDAVVVTNSLEQLKRLSEAVAGKSQSLAELPEYTFFRERYKRGEAGEVGLLILSDATIRRWCGPKWRIATSRRTRATAVLSELQAEQLDALVKRRVTPQKLNPDFVLASGTTAELNGWGISSPIYGTLNFQTPIQELDLDKVTRQEAEFYNRWRDGYQQNWRRFFDPIAVQLKLNEDRVTMDLTVLPLIAGTDYRQMINISAGATLKPDAGDLHAETLIHFVLAINKESELLKRNVNMLQGMAPQLRANPLSWLGDSFAIYLDQDKFWEEAAAADKIDDFMEKNFHRLPVAINVEVSNALKLTAFLAGVRAFIEQAAPGLTAWETKEHAGRSYVKISATEEARRSVGDEDRELALYYAPSATSLVISLNEDTLKQSLDRQIAAAKAKQEGKELPAASPPWIGGNVGLQVHAAMIAITEAFGRRPYQKRMQSVAWSNLAILNEWKRRYPDLSPVEVHEEYWQRRLVCPGGGEYVWNKKWQTMESTVYGHPGEPKDGPPMSTLLSPYSFGNFGLTFEHGGLQARVELDRAAAGEKKAAERPAKAINQ